MKCCRATNEIPARTMSAPKDGGFRKTTPVAEAKTARRYRPDDKLLAFLKSL